MALDLTHSGMGSCNDDVDKHDHERELLRQPGGRGPMVLVGPFTTLMNNVDLLMMLTGHHD